MQIATPTRLEKWVSRFLRLWRRPSREAGEMPPPETLPLTRLYASAMFEEGNFFHRHLIRRMARRVGLDETHLESLHLKVAQGALVYVTLRMGQSEYNIFNQIFLKENLPLVPFNNALRTRAWWPLRKIFESFRERIRFLARHAQFPDPIWSGHLKNLMRDGKSLLFSLDDFDPTYLSTPSRNLLQFLFEAQTFAVRPIFVVPLQLVWDKRPRRDQPSVYESLFGENERPSRLRKLILFLRHYRTRALVKFGEPIPLKDFQAPEKLYQKILGSLTLSKRTLTGPPIRPRSWFLERIFDDEGLNRALYEVAKEKNRPIASVQRLARRYAKEIAADVYYSRVEFGVACIDFLFRILFDKMFVDEEGLLRLKKILSKGPTILVPNHRSHFDYLLMAYLCYQHDIVVPYVAAGINMSFWPLGKFFRHCGAFYLRRTFGGNKLYKKVFQTYLKTLLQEGYLQEFFIEGGRSRTGKLRPPRLGMISMVTDAMQEQAAKDIFFVPISITYDRVIEQQTYLQEVEGKPKPKEKTRDLLKLGKFLKRRYGNIYVRFEEPISWQQVAAETGEMPWEKKKPQIVEELSQKICHAINRQVVIIPQSLAAAALLNTSKKGMPVEKSVGLFKEIFHYLQWKQSRFSDSLSRNPEGACAQALHQFELSGLIKRHQGLEESFFEIPAEKRLELDFFKNTTIHYLVSLSLWSNLLLTRKSEKFSLDHLAEPYAYLQKLFRYEFRFSTRLPLNQHLDKICCYLQERKLIEYADGHIVVLKEGRPLLEEFSRLTRNFVEGYLVAWKTVVLRPIYPLEEKNLIQAMMIHGKHLLMLGTLQHPEALSQAIFENAIQSFKALGLFAQESAAAKKLEESLEKLLAILPD